jgi:MinD-like ATPase involved in chromosome partitioning or flagellar assembly
MSTQPRHDSPGGDVSFITPKPEDSRDKTTKPREQVTRLEPGRQRPTGKPQETVPAEIRPEPTMGWQATWWKFIKTFNPKATPPRLSQKETEFLQQQAEEKAQLAAQQAEKEAARAKAHAEAEAARAQIEADAEAKRELRRESIERLNEYSNRVPSLNIVMIGVKGSAGTSTTTAYTSSVHADNTRSTVVGTDFNPAQGTLAGMLGKDYNETTTLRELLSDIDGFTSFKAFIRKIRPTRYGVRPISANDIVGVNEHLDAEAAGRILDTIRVNCEYHYVDTANDITTDVMLKAIAEADVLVFTAYVGVQRSLQLLAVGMETLRRHGFEEKVANSVVVITGVEPGKSANDYRKYTDRVDMKNEVVAKYDFKGPILGIPYDPFIKEDTEVNLEAIHPDTYQAYLDLALCILEQAPDFDNPNTGGQNDNKPSQSE